MVDEAMNSDEVRTKLDEVCKEASEIKDGAIVLVREIEAAGKRADDARRNYDEYINQGEAALANEALGKIKPCRKEAARLREELLKMRSRVPELQARQKDLRTRARQLRDEAENGLKIARAIFNQTDEVCGKTTGVLGDINNLDQTLNELIRKTEPVARSTSAGQTT